MPLSPIFQFYGGGVEETGVPGEHNHGSLQIYWLFRHSFFDLTKCHFKYQQTYTNTENYLSVWR